ncbi:MAG: exosortase F system-associated membrane protein [Flavobacterium sp.]
MLRNLHQHKLKVALGVLLIFFFVLIRAFETHLFYDPFLAFFKSEYAGLSLPNFEPFQLFVGLLLRYGLNTILSLALLYVIFEDKKLLQFSGVLFAIFFVVLVTVLFCLLHYHQNYMFIFYIRRFLIQPIFILLFIPGFYYQKMRDHK